MLENIINNMKTQLTGELQSKYNLEPDKANRSVDLAKDNLLNEVKHRAGSGDMGGLLDVLKGSKGLAESSAVNQVIRNYVGDLTRKLGIPDTMARQIGPFVITFVMNKLSGQVGAGGAGQGDLLGSLLGGGLGSSLGKGLGDKLGGLFK